MSVFKRLFKLGQAEAHSAINKFEDPIKMTEQGIRDLKKDLTASMESLAQIKAMAIRMDRDKIKFAKQAEEWEKKAVLLLQRIESGAIEAAEGEKLAREALLKKEDALKKTAEAKTNAATQNDMVGKLTVKIEQLKRRVSEAESDLTTLKARARTAEATLKINKQLSNIDSSSTISMLERMKEKVDEDESLATAYGELDSIGGDLDKDIDRLLDTSSTQGDDLLADLKLKMKTT